MTTLGRSEPPVYLIYAAAFPIAAAYIPGMGDDLRPLSDAHISHDNMLSG